MDVADPASGQGGSRPPDGCHDSETSKDSGSGNRVGHSCLQLGVGYHESVDSRDSVSYGRVLTPRASVRRASWVPFSSPGSTAELGLNRLLVAEFGELGIGPVKASEAELDRGWGGLRWFVGLGMSRVLKPTSKELAFRGPTTCLGRLIQHRLLAWAYLVLMGYALFVPDLDVMLGDKSSRQIVGIMTAGVLAGFLAELLLQIWVEPRYCFRPCLWLDLLVLISLLPDTYFLQVLLGGDLFASNRVYWLLHFVHPSHSSRATQLSRLTRIVRAAALIPRLLAIGKRQASFDAEQALEKKLFRIFSKLDTDLDGIITDEETQDLLLTLKGESRARLDTPPTGVPTSVLTSLVSINTRESMGCRCATPCGSPGGTFANFLEDFNQEAELKARLLSACRKQHQTSTDTQMLTSWHSNNIGGTIALGVLLMLLVLTLIEPNIQDHSASYSLGHIDTCMRERFPNHTDAVPGNVREQVQLWMQVNSAQRVVYLDIRRLVYCNELVPSGRRCELLPGDAEVQWAPRQSLAQVDRDVLTSGFRLTDLVPVRVPDLSGADSSGEQLEVRTDTVAVLDAQLMIREEALMSILTTLSVLVIILLNILLITKDFAYLSTRLLKPLRALAEDMQSIVHLQLAALSTPDHLNLEQGTAEMRQIQRIFNKMKKAIRSWGKYVPWPVVELLLHADVDAKPAVEEREVTLVFSDIASFTTIVESIPPEDSLRLLSRYFNDMSKVIDGHGGIVIEYIGDAILAMCGAPQENPDHATAAVRATLRMRSSLARMNTWSATHGLPEVRIRCGVHTGSVLVGNMGFHSRIKYGVVGENANIPGCLEELNKHYRTDMLISAATYDNLDRSAFIIRPIDYVHLRHTPGAEREPIYQVMCRSAPKSQKLKPVAALHAQAMDCYLSREFEEAAKLFGQVNEKLQEVAGVQSDFPSILMMKRCKAYFQSPPPAEWSGVWDQGSEPS